MAYFGTLTTPGKVIKVRLGLSQTPIGTGSSQTITATGTLTVDGHGIGSTHNPTINAQGDLTISASAKLTSTSGALTVGGNYSNSGTFTHNSGTVTFNATDTGNTIQGTLSGSTGKFNNLIFNGSSGEWTPNAAVEVVNDLTMTAGTLLGTQNVTVNGTAAGTAGIITLTGGTFENRVAANKNFGTSSGSNAWTFYELTFSNSHGSSPFVITTQTGGSGGITVSSILRVGKSGDAAGATTTLNAGNRIWTLSGTAGDPFQLLASPLGVLAGGTSKFYYTGANGAGNTTIQSTSGSYYDLEINADDAFVLEEATVVTNNLTITLGTLDVTAGNFALTIGNNYSNAGGTFTAQSGTVTFNATDTGNTLAGTMTGGSAFFNLVFDGVAGGWTYSNAVAATNDFTVINGAVTANNLALTVTRDFTLANTSGVSYTAGSSTITVSRHFTNNGDKFVEGTSTVNMTGTGTLASASGFYNLGVAYTGFVTTSSGINGGNSTTNQLALNGGTMTYGASYVNTGCTGTCTPIVFNSATTINGGGVFYFWPVGASAIMTIPAGDYGNWSMNFAFTNNNQTYTQTGATITSQWWSFGTYAYTGGVYNTNGNTVTATAGISLGARGSTGSATVNFGASTVNSGSFLITSAGAGLESWTLNLESSTLNFTTNVDFTASAHAQIAVLDGGSSTVNFNSNSTRTYTPAGFSLYNGNIAAGANSLTLGGAAIFTNNFTITSGTFDVSAAPYALTIGGNYSNSGTFTARTGTVTLNGSATQTLSGTMTTTSAFYNLTLTNSSGTSPSDNERTGWVAGIDFNASATVTNNYVITTANVRVEYNSGSTYTIANINWNGAAIGTRIYFRNSAITGTWLLNVSGIQIAVSYVNVSRSDASSGSAIVASDGTNFNAQNNTNWTFSGTVTGTVYGTDESTAVVSGPTVRMYINGTTTETTTANGSGVFTFTTGTNANDVLSIYLDTAGGITGSTVTKATGSALSNIHIYQDRLTTRCDNTCSLTNTNIDSWDKGNDTDIHATVTTSNLVVDNDWKLKVTNNTFAPGGTITTSPAGGSSYQGQVGIDASSVLDMAGFALSIGGNYSNSGTFTSGSNTTSFTDTATGNTLAGTMTGASSFYNLVFDGVAGGWTYSSAVAATNDFTVTNGAVTANNLALTVTRDFTLANTSGVSYIAGSSTLTVSRHFTDTGYKYAYGTSTLILNGTGTLTALNNSSLFYNISLAYTTFTSTVASQIRVSNTFTVNGGTLTKSGSVWINLQCSGSCTPMVFAAPTAMTGGGTFYQQAGGTTPTKTIAAGDYGNWNLNTTSYTNSATYQLGGTVTTTGTFRLDSNNTGLVFNTQNYTLNVGAFTFGSAGWLLQNTTANFGSSTINVTGNFYADASAGNHTVNLNTSTVNVGGNWQNLNGTGSLILSPGTSTVNMTATTTGKTITSNGQSFYNLVFNGVGGGWTFQDATIATNDFTVTNGAVTANNLALTVTRDFTLANTAGVSYTAGSSTITVSRHWNDTGTKFVYGTSTVALNGTGTIAVAAAASFNHLSVGYSTFTTTFPSGSGGWQMMGQLTFNGGTVTNGGGGTWFHIRVNGTNNTPVVFASPTTITGINSIGINSNSAGPYTVTVAGGNYGSWGINLYGANTGVTFQLGGNLTTSFYFRQANSSGGDSIFNTQNYNITSPTYQFGQTGSSCLSTAANWGSSTITLSGTGDGLYVESNCGAHTLNMGSANIDVKGNVKFVNGTGTIAVTASTSTLTWTNTSGTKTYSPNGQLLYNITLNGSGGTVTPDAAVIVANDLTMTAGTLNGTQNVTVNGAVAGTAGIISLTGGTFEQRVGAAKNFGTTSGSAAWTFYDLTFSNSHGSSPFTVTTQTGGTGGITVSDILKVGKSGDSAGATTTLDAGNRTWTLSGTGGDPFQILASPLGVLTGATSTFKYTGNNAGGNTTIQSTSGSYYNLEINDGLQGYWKMDEGTGTNAVDVSGNGNDGTLGGATGGLPTWTTSVSSNNHYGGSGSDPYGVTLDGNDDKMEKSSYSGFPTTVISAAFWIKTSDTSNGMISYASSGSDNAFLLFDSNNITVYINGSSRATGVDINDNAWHHVVVTWRSSDGQLDVYKDGVSGYSNTFAASAVILGGGCLEIGQEQDSVCGGLDAGQATAGSFNDVRIYNRLLSSTEASALAAGNHPTYETYVLEADTTVTNNLGVRTGALDVTASNFALTVGGNLTNVSNFAPNSGTVTMNSTASGKTIQSDPAFYKLKFHNASGGGGWTSQNRLLVDTTSGTPAADALVIGNGTVTIGDGNADNLLVYGGIDIAVNANETGILQTMDALAEGSTITLQVNKDTSTQCANCIVDVGASSGSGQGTLTINENGILKLIPKSSATASDTGVEVASTGKLNVTGALSLAATTSTAITDYDNRETKLCATADFSAGYTSKHVRATTGLAIGQIYPITATTVNDAQCDTATDDSITRADTSTASVVSASRTLSLNNTIMAVCIPDSITANDQKIGSYMRDFTGTKGYFQIVDSANDSASCTGTDDLLKVIESPDVFSGFTSGDTVDISDGVRPGDQFEIYDYANVTAEDGVACTAAVNEAGESYIYAIAGSEIAMTYADICNLGRNTFSKNGVSLYTLNGTNANEGITIDRSRLRNGYDGAYLSATTNNNTGNSKGITNSSATGNADYGFRLISGANSNTLTSNTASNNTLYGIRLDSSNSNILTSNTANNNTQRGINLTTSSNNTLTSNSAVGNISKGILIETSSYNNTLTSNTAIGNVDVGIQLINAYNNTLTSNSAIANSSDGIILVSASNNYLSSNSSTSNTDEGFFIYLSSNNNTFKSNTATNNTNYGFRLYDGSNNNILTSNQSGGQSRGLAVEGTVSTGNVVIDDVYGTSPNTVADIVFGNVGAHTLSLYNTTLSSSTEVTGVTLAASYIVSRKHDGVAGSTKIWGEYAIPSDTAETPQDEDTDKFNYANNLWEKSVTAHRYSGTGTEDTNLSYDLTAPADLSAGPYAYRLVTKTAGVGASCVTSQAVMDVYRNGTDVGDLTTGTLFTDSTGAVNTKFTVDCGATPYALNATYTFTAFDADNSTSTATKTVTVQQDGDIITVPSGGTMQFDGGVSNRSTLAVLTPASMSFDLTNSGTISGGYNDLTVTGSVNGSNGTYSMTTGSILIQRVIAASKTFGNSGAGSNGWTLQDLKFENASGATKTVTTNGTNTGSIITSGTLTIGKATDSFSTTLDNETNDRIIDADGDVTITGFGVLQASSTASFTIGSSYINDGTLTAGTGTVTFDSTSTGKTLGGQGIYNTPFYNLTFNGVGGAWELGNDGPMFISNDLTITNGTVTSSFYGLKIGGSYSNSGTFTHNSASVIMSATDTGNTLGGTMTGASAFYDLTFDGVAGDWSFGANAVTFANDLTITNGTVTAPSTTLTIGGNYSNSGTFTANSGTVTLDGSATQTLSGTMTTTSAFYNLTLTNSSGTSPSDNERTGWVAGIDFNASATVTNNYVITTANVRVEYNSGSTYTIANINWNGAAIGTRIYFRNSAITGTWLLNVSGIQTAVSYVNVSRSDASSGSAIVASDGTNFNAQNNTNWTFSGTVTGTVYGTDETTAVATGPTVRMYINGTTTETAVANGSGVFTFTTGANANDVLSIYLDTAGGIGGLTVTKATGSALSNIHIYQSRLTTRCDNTCSLTNANIDNWDKGNDTDIHATVTTSNLVVDSDWKLKVTNNTFAPGGTITTSPAGGSSYQGQVGIDASSVLDMAGNALSIGGNYSNSGTFTSGSNTTTFTDTATGNTLAGTMTGASSFYNLVFDGVAGGWTYSNAVAATNDYTVTNGAVTANNLALTVTRDFTLANTSGVSYTAGSSTITVSRHWTDSGAKFVSGTSTVALNGTGTMAFAYLLFYNLSIGYSGFTTTLPNTTFGITSGGTMTVNGGTVAGGGNFVVIHCVATCTPFVFASPTSLTGTMTVYYEADAGSFNMTIAGGNYGSWQVSTNSNTNNTAYILGGDLTTTSSFRLRAPNSGTGNTFSTQNYAINAANFTFGYVATGAFAASFGSSVITLTSDLQVASNGGTHTLNMQTSTVDVKGNVTFVNGTGTIAVTPGTSTLTMSAVATGKTITSNAQSFYNLVFNGVGGGWTLQDAMSVTNNFSITNGTFDTNTTFNYALTIGGNLTGNAGTWTLTERASTITVSGNWDTSAVATDSTSIVEGTSTVVMNGTGTKTLKTGATSTWLARFYNLNVGQSGNTTQLLSNTGMNGTISLGTGTFDLNTFSMQIDSLITTPFSLNPAGTWGTSSGTLYVFNDSNPTTNYNLPAFTYNSSVQTNQSTGSKTTFQGTTIINGNLSIGCCSRASEFDLSGQTVTVSGNVTFNTTTAILTMGAATLNVGGNFTNVAGAVFTANTSTVNFTSTTTGKTITSAGDSFYNLTFNGSGGAWTPQDALVATNDLTMTAGTLSGTQNVTVNGSVAGTAGIISLTGGTFEQRVIADKNFGTTSGSTAWTFSDLTFSNSCTSICNPQNTVTTQTGATGGITVSGVLRVGKSGDTYITVLNAGNRTWTLSGTAGDPFQILASPLGVLTGATSTFKYTGNNAGGNTTIQSTSGSYYNLEVNDGLVGYWKMDEGTGTSTTADISGTGATGTLYNSPTWTTAVNNNNYYGGSGSDPYGLDFSVASSQYIQGSYNAALNPSAFTISAWARVEGGAGTWRSVITSRDSTPAGYIIYAGSDNKWQFWTGAGTWKVVTGPTITDNVWYHLIATYDGVNMYLFVDGTSYGPTASTLTQNTVRDLRIGAGATEGSPNYYFEGKIDDVRVYNRVLGTTERTDMDAGNHPTYETYVLEADTTVTNNLGVRTGSLDVTASNYALTVGGNLTNVSNFAPNSGTVTMNSTASGKTIQSDPAFYKLKFHNASGGGGWTSQNRLLVDTTSGTPAADALVIGNGTVTIGDGSADNLLVYGGIDIAVNANETGILQTMDALAEGSTITLQVNKDTSTQCANCIVDVGASSGSGQGTLTINENGILKLIPKSSATASDTGVEVASTGKLNVIGALSLAATTSTAITDYDIRETKICANATFTTDQYNSLNVRATSGLAIGQIYPITDTTVDDAQCDTSTHDSITRADTSTASVVSASKAISVGNTIMTVCIPDSITADNQKIGSYMRDFTGTKGYFQITDSVNDYAGCSGTNDYLKVIASPDAFSGFTAGDTVDISDGVRPGDQFEIYDYANVTAEDGVACTATANEAGESYIRAIAGSETAMNYADVCNLGRNATSKYGVQFDTVNGTNASEGVTIDRSRLRSNYYGTYLNGATNNNTGNSKGITNSSSTSNLSYGFQLLNSANSNTFTSNAVSSNLASGFFLNSTANSNTFTSNTTTGNAGYGFYFNASSANNTLTSNVSTGNTSYGFYLLSSSTNNTLTSNSAIGNASGGFLTQNSANSNTFTSNSALGNSGYGFNVNNVTNNSFTSNTVTGNGTYGIALTTSASRNTFTSNTTNDNGTYGILIYGVSNNTFTGNQSGGQSYGLAVDNTTATGNVVISDVYGTAPNTSADVLFAGAGAHTLSLYNTTLSSSTEVTGVTVAGAYIVSRKHDTSAGATKIWGEYAIPADTAESPQVESTDKFNYANNLWEKSVTAHGYSGTGTEDTNLAYDLSAPADLSGGPYAYKLVTKTAGVGASCVTSQAVMDVYRNGTDVGDLTTGTLFTDSTGAVNTKFTVDCGATPYALNATYTFTAFDADNSTSVIKPMTMMQDGDIFTVGSGKTLEMKGQTTSTNLSTVTRGASGGYHFDVAGTIDAQYYKFSYLGGTSGGTGLDLQSGATLTNLDDGQFDNFQNVGATDTYMKVHGSLIGTGAPAKTWDNMIFLEASDNVPEYSVTQIATGAPAAGNYWVLYPATCTGWASCEASDSDTGDGGSDTLGFLHWTSAPIAPSSLVQMKTDDTVLATGDWTNEASVKFTALASDPDAADTLYLCVEKDPVATALSSVDGGDLCGSGVAYTGTPVTVTVTISGLVDGTQYHWQAQVKDAATAYSSWTGYGGNTENPPTNPADRDFGVDTTACTYGSSIYDGTVEDVDASYNDGSLTSVSANWDAYTCDASGLNKYQYSIGTTAGGTDIKTWTDNSTTESVTSTSLILRTNQNYFFNVRAVDNATNTSGVTSSNGQSVLPTISLSLGAVTITFANLNNGNNRTDSKTLTLTSSTNAYGGYVIRQYASSLLTKGIKTIPMFEGGSYASPGAWPGGTCTPSTNCGYGYTSDDTTIQGVNIFSGGTLYAPLRLTEFGDIVADHTTAVDGTSGPVTNEAFTITHKVSVSELQEANPYTTEVLYILTGTF